MLGRKGGGRRVDSCDGRMTHVFLGIHSESYTFVRLVCANSYDKKNKLKTVKSNIIF